MTDHVTDRSYFAGRVLRYHTWPTIYSQTVGEHSWQVALIYERIFGKLSPPVERFIRLHDAAELVVGDPPFPVKMNNPALKKAYDEVEITALDHMRIASLPELMIYERWRIKVCDLLEMTIFGMVEREMGNRLAIPVIERTKAAALDFASKLSEDEYQKVLKFVDEAERQYCEVLGQKDK